MECVACSEKSQLVERVRETFDLPVLPPKARSASFPLTWPAMDDSLRCQPRSGLLAAGRRGACRPVSVQAGVPSALIAPPAGARRPGERLRIRRRGRRAIEHCARLSRLRLQGSPTPVYASLGALREQLYT